MPVNNVAVFITGDPSPHARSKYKDYGQLFFQLLNNPEDNWHFFDTRLFEYPSDISQFHVVIISGSPATANEPLPWILELKDRIRDAHRQGVKLLGICFGHQVIAESLGGRTIINPNGWEIGLHSLVWRNRETDPFLASVQFLPEDVLQVHRDIVVSLPKDADLLASSPLTKVQVYRIGTKVLCIQGHPEFFNDIVSELIEIRHEKGILNKEVATSARESLGNLPNRSSWVELIKMFFKL